MFKKEGSFKITTKKYIPSYWKYECFLERIIITCSLHFSLIKCHIDYILMGKLYSLTFKYSTLLYKDWALLGNERVYEKVVDYLW